MHRGPKKISKAKNFWPTTRRLIAYLRPWKVGVVLSIILAITSVILSIIAPKILGEATTVIYNGVMKGYHEMRMGQHLTSLPIDFHRILQIGIIVILLYIFSGLFSFAQQVIMTRISQRVVYKLRQDLKQKLSRVPVNMKSKGIVKPIPLEKGIAHQNDSLFYKTFSIF